ncbi:ribonuclease H1 [Favolaschia claudopus]|uniref:Ribonuclease H1 n=1 Tax=Favolaschia claudopus TaxID=2862362 RepID=A0AAW0D6F3_9AGAR
MPFTLQAWADGACRRNGSIDAVGGAGVSFPRYPQGNRSEVLPHPPRATNQRAELYALILALEAVIEKQDAVCANANHPPFFIVTIHADSRYAIHRDLPVVNADLVKEAHNLRGQIEDSYKGGQVEFKWIPREENVKADEYANDACDRAEEESRRRPDNQVYALGIYVRDTSSSSSSSDDY